MCMSLLGRLVWLGWSRAADVVWLEPGYCGSLIVLLRFKWNDMECSFLATGLLDGCMYFYFYLLPLLFARSITYLSTYLPLHARTEITFLIYGYPAELWWKILLVSKYNALLTGKLVHVHPKFARLLRAELTNLKLSTIHESVVTDAR